MIRTQGILRATLLATVSIIASPVLSQADHAPRAVLPDAVVDLRATDGVAQVKAQWRYSDAHIDEIDHRSVGPDLKASGPKNRTSDFTPDARATDFDDSRWEVIPADSLEKRRGNGRLSMNWYRINVAIPDKVSGLETRGSTAVFEVVVGDYAEVWVNGKAPFVLGQSGGTAAAGWNAPNRVVLTKNARAGEKHAIAVLGINGPLATHPDTYIWVRSATLDFYAPGKLSKAREVKLDVDRKNFALDAILPRNAKLERLADGFTFTEVLEINAENLEFKAEAAAQFVLPVLDEAGGADDEDAPGFAAGDKFADDTHTCKDNEKVLSVLRSPSGPMPYFTPGGTLVIPFDSPERFHW
jgi:gluconolactonase